VAANVRSGHDRSDRGHFFTGADIVKPLSLVFAAAIVVAGCSSNADKTQKDSTGAAAPAAAATTTSGVALTGAGATFPNPIYSKWFDAYASKTGVKINYQSIGSGGGIRQLSEQTVDFGASDAPMSDDELAQAKGGPIQHVPTVLGAVCITYNLAEVTKTLNLTGDVIAEIYLGKITKWNDSRIAALNKGVTLPNRDIVVVHRSDGSGTSYIFTDYLSTVSAAWKTAPGKGKDVAWPVGLGAKGNEGVTGQVKQTPGAVGYVELAYARQNKLPTAGVRNAAGQFVQPSIEAVTAAAAGAAQKLPPNADYRISIVNAPGARAYPISSFTWILLYKTQPNAEKGKQLLDFLHWALHDGEQLAPSLDYAPLPAVLVTRLDSTLATIKIGATP
jgi:phosphate transport system substrate-binding protein